MPLTFQLASVVTKRGSPSCYQHALPLLPPLFVTGVVIVLPTMLASCLPVFLAVLFAVYMSSCLVRLLAILHARSLSRCSAVSLSGWHAVPPFNSLGSQIHVRKVGWLPKEVSRC